MTPSEMIADLDAATASWGEDITLRRTTGTQQIPLDVECRACVRGYQPNELIGSIEQGDRKVILSPTEMKHRQWTWPPKRGDRVLFGDKSFHVEAVDNISAGSELVRIEIQARG